MALWGLAFGGAGTLSQTASAQAAGASADVAQSMLVTAWKLAIAGDGGWAACCCRASARAPCPGR